MTGTTSGAPYRTTTAAAVTAIGANTAATARMALEEIHLASQIELRETGFEATHASVPLSRSRTMRLATAKIAARMKICDPMAPTRLSSGAIETGASGGSTSGGRLLMISWLIQAFAAARTMNSVVIVNTIQARLPRSHSVVSLRMRAPRPANRP
jgi:hypothetical protein